MPPMAMVCLRVPAEVGNILESVEVPGERTPASEMHVTMFYLGKETSVIEMARAMVVASGLTSVAPPLLVTLREVSSFPVNPDDGMPVICPVLSPGLVALRSAMAAAFDSSGVPYSKKYPDFKPHVTLSYVKPGPAGTDPGPYSAKLPGPVVFTATGVSIYGDELLARVELPFTLGVAERVAARMAGTVR